LTQQQQFLISALIQFVLNTQQNSVINKISVFQKSSFAETLFISSVFTFLIIVQQSILYMSVSALKSAEASHFNEMNITDFLET